jgi:phosphoserine phosphatase RsbU/P
MFRLRINNPSYFATMFMAVHDPVKREWRCMNCGHPNPVVVRNRLLVDASLFDEGGGAPLGFPFGDERPYSKGDEVVFKDEGDTFLLFYTDGLAEAVKENSREDCSKRLAEVYEEVVCDSAIPNKASELMDLLESEGYLLGEDDCTAISIHLIDPKNIVLERWVSRDIGEVSNLAKDAETLCGEHGISSEAAAQVRLLLMELGANLVDHSGLEEHEQFWVQLRVDGSVCQMVLIDEGDEWDLEQALLHGRDPEYLSDRGRGLTITHSIVDRIERYRVNTENMTYCTIVDGEKELV